jgi:hypothetical protein
VGSGEAAPRVLESEQGVVVVDDNQVNDTGGMIDVSIGEDGLQIGSDDDVGGCA